MDIPKSPKDRFVLEWWEPMIAENGIYLARYQATYEKKENTWQVVARLFGQDESFVLHRHSYDYPVNGWKVLVEQIPKRVEKGESFWTPEEAHAALLDKMAERRTELRRRLEEHDRLTVAWK